MSTKTNLLKNSIYELLLILLCVVSVWSAKLANCFGKLFFANLVVQIIVKGVENHCRRSAKQKVVCLPTSKLIFHFTRANNNNTTYKFIPTLHNHKMTINVLTYEIVVVQIIELIELLQLRTVQLIWWVEATKYTPGA
jgi:hypothetical protein